MAFVHVILSLTCLSNFVSCHPPQGFLSISFPVALTLEPTKYLFHFNVCIADPWI